MPKTENTEALKAAAFAALQSRRNLSGIMELTFSVGAMRDEPLELPPRMCEHTAEMLKTLWKIIDHQSKHIEEMHAILDALNSRVDESQKQS